MGRVLTFKGSKGEEEFGGICVKINDHEDMECSKNASQIYGCFHFATGKLIKSKEKTAWLVLSSF